MNALLLALAALQVQGPLDEGTFVVRQDTSEVAREDFRLLAGRPAGGWSLGATARYDHGSRRPTAILSPILELNPDTTPATLQYDFVEAAAGQPTRILGQAGRGRFTLRYLSRGSERARELAAGPNTVVLDDSVFALYLFVAWRARPAPAAVTLSAVFPRSARRETITVRDEGVQPTTLNRDRATLRHLTVSGASGGPVHLWLDDRGRLMKVEIPDRRLIIERLPVS